jgi:2-phosphosulfolactate phosphatase
MSSYFSSFSATTVKRLQASKIMKIIRSSLLTGAKNARGVAVIIDVYRAFSCTPLLFSLGIKSSLLVSTPAEAFDLKKRVAGLVLVGEISGAPIEGFDFGNSPRQILDAGIDTFEGRTVVQRTSSGVQGALAALETADEVLLGSYGLAAATAKYILANTPREVSLVAMGWDLKEMAPEDECCARYIAHLLDAGPYDHLQALHEIISHESTQKFLRRDKSYFPSEDPIFCLQRDIYDFVLRVRQNADLVRVEKYIPE